MATLTLVRNVQGTAVFYLSKAGVPVLDLTSTQVKVDLKKATDTGFANKPLTNATNASASFGSGVDGVVTVEVPGTAGNAYTISVVAPVGTSPLSVSLVGTAITVNLAVSAGIPIAAQNTALLIAQTIDDAVANAFATFSGDGSGSVSSASGPTTLTGGTDGDFTDMGGGYYSLVLSASNLNVAGNLYVRITGATIDPVLEAILVVDSIVPTPPVITPPNTTVIYGTVLKADGSPAIGASVSARPLSVPSIVSGIAITTDLITAKTDSYGQFTLLLIEGSQVDVFIPSVNYRRTITVPASSADLFTIV